MEFTPKDGKTIAGLVAQMGKTPESVIKRYKALVADKPGG
jgi:hypothetical protein